MFRYKVEKQDCLIRGLNQVGWAVFTEPVRDAENLPSHRHEQQLEICYIVHGSVEWYVRDRIYEVKAGQVFIAFPGEVHGGVNDVMNPCELYWAQVDTSRGEPWAGLTSIAQQSLFQRINSFQRRVFPATGQLPEYFKRIIDEHRHRDQYSGDLVQISLVGLLAELLRSYDSALMASGSENRMSNLSPAIGEACKLLRKNLEQKINISELAAHVNLSRTVFYRLFTEETHLTPKEYVIQQRIERARFLLRRRNDLSIVQIACQLGFASSQYFATVFKRYTGVSPSAYREGS